MDLHRAISPQNYKQLSRRPAVCLRLSISSQRQKNVFGGIRFKNDDSKDPVRSDVLGVVEAAYHMVKCSLWTLRVCNTVIKIDVFHTDSNFSTQYTLQKLPEVANFAEFLHVEAAGEAKYFPLPLLHGRALPADLQQYSYAAPKTRRT